MGKKSNTTPNQRLLDMIRQPSGAEGEQEAPASVPSATPSVHRRRGVRLPFGKPVQVGVDIAPSQLVCVMTRGKDAGFELLGTSLVVVPAGVEPGSDAFADLLRQTLSELCGPGPTPRIWAAAQSARANLQFLTIPKIASRQVDNAVFWTAKKEMAFEEASVVFDFERRGELSEKGAARLGAMAYTMPRETLARLQGAFAKAGFPLTGLTLEPFAHQTLLRRRVTPESAGAVANLHVGQNWSRLEIFSNGNLMFVRVIKTSMSGMEQAVLEALEARQQEAEEVAADRTSTFDAPTVTVAPAASPETGAETVLDLDFMGRADSGLVLELEPQPAAPEPPAPPVPEPSVATPSPERTEATLTRARELLHSIIFTCESMGTCHPADDIGPDDVMVMLEPVASRLVRQAEMTLKHYRESLGYDAVTRLTVSGPLGASPLFVHYIGEQLGLPCTPLDPLAGRPAACVCGAAPQVPSTVFSQALGLALSDLSVTPSVLFTYQEKATARASRLFEQWTLVGLAAALGVMAVLYGSAASDRRALERQRDGIDQEITALGQELDPASVTRLTAELRHKRENLQRYVSRNRTAGVWGEALALAPDGVTLGTVTAEFGPPDKMKTAPAGKGAPAGPAGPVGKDTTPQRARLVIDGMITGDSRLFDSMLASYVVALEGSPLFEEVTVKKSEIEALEGGATGLRFVVGLNLTEN